MFDTGNNYKLSIKYRTKLNAAKFYKVYFKNNKELS